MKVLALPLGALFLLVMTLGGCALTVSSVTGTGPPAVAAATPGAARPGTPAVPAAWETLDQQAAATCQGLSWTLLAAIGRLESDSGRSTLPGVQSGANSAGAEGPMQFEPATFAAYAVVGPGGAQPASPYDPVDAVYTAAHMLCANGAADDPTDAVFAYNHSTGYVNSVLVLAAALGDQADLDTVQAGVLTFAAQQLGVPYLYGGDGPGGFDCSGLSKAAYASVGVSIPRVAQDQFDAGPRVDKAQPGDLVFFGTSTSDVEHVGIHVAGGLMIDAPHTGADVRFDQIPADGSFGDQVEVGATHPA